MKAHTTYKIYPKAIKEFINDHYDLSTINFGNIEKNVKAILQKLGLDSILECQWDVSHLYFFDKVDISRQNNKPTDFDEYSNFIFAFTSLKDKKSTKEYEDAIEILEKQFINKYQDRIALDYKKGKKEKLKKEKKKEKLTYILIGLVFVALAAVLFIFKSMQE